MKKICLLILALGVWGCDSTSQAGDTESEPGEGSLSLSSIDPSDEEASEGTGGEQSSSEDICLLPKEPGSCEALFPAFYFDSDEGECLEFNYGGCDGNDNRFDTLEECQLACGESVGGETSDGDAGWESPGASSGESSENSESDSEADGGEITEEADEGGEADIPEGVDPDCYEECIDSGEGEDACLGLCRIEAPSEEGGSEEGGEEGGEIELPEGVDPECYLECMASGEPQDYCFGLCRVGPEEEGGEGGPDTVDGYPFGSLVCTLTGSGLGVGQASYHFVSPSKNYISYEKAPPEWGMDNGQKLTAQKDFIEVSWDFEERQFNGEVNWNDPEGTSVSGTNYWVYELQFSEDYGYIQAGFVNTYFGFLFIDSKFYPDDYYYECSTNQP